MEDLLTFAIGDVHGCFDKLEALLLACDRVRAGREVRYVFIGDYIDRGPDARKVIDLLMHKRLREGDRFVCLRGNHEQMLIVAAAEGRSDRDLMTWWANGGAGVVDPVAI
jgi:serine/threonine protein phosphatase 1